MQAPIPRKLPLFHLLDSLIKTYGAYYSKHFAPKLVEIFESAFISGNTEMKRSLLKLHKIWALFFPPKIMNIIANKLQFEIYVSRLSRRPCRSRSFLRMRTTTRSNCSSASSTSLRRAPRRLSTVTGAATTRPARRLLEMSLPSGRASFRVPCWCAQSETRTRARLIRFP